MLIISIDSFVLNFFHIASFSFQNVKKMWTLDTTKNAYFHWSQLCSRGRHIWETSYMKKAYHICVLYEYAWSGFLSCQLSLLPTKIFHTSHQVAWGIFLKTRKQHYYSSQLIPHQHTAYSSIYQYHGSSCSVRNF